MKDWINEHSKECVERVIRESPDMISALEAVGAMYGIQPTHIIGQPGLKTIRVQDDCIIAPTDAKPNTKAIVCAIGAVLDRISQRINDKVDNFQADNINKGKIDERIKTTANPSKGKVIGRYVDDNGGEILAYDSGLVDIPNTPTAQAKVAELRANGTIPEIINDQNDEYVKPSYFTKDDDITNGIDSLGLNSNEPEELDMEAVTGESRLHLEMYNHFGCTDFMGYAILQEQGFDYVRMTEAFVTEASKSKKEIVASDIKHMKFDNTEITKAIKCFNEARAAQPNVGKGEFNIKAFQEHPKYIEAIKHLCNQFNCQISLYFHEYKDEPDATMLYTAVYYDLIAQHLTISKTKGFQLGGLPIQIHAYNKAIDEEMTNETNINLFGQFITAGLCHEIFHNIANAIRLNNSTFIFNLESAMNLAVSTDNATKRREVFDRFASTLTNGKNDPISKLQRKRIVSSLCKASALIQNKTTLNELKDGIKTSKNAEQEIDKLIRYYEDKYSVLKKQHDAIVRRGKRYMKSPVIGIIAVILCFTIVGVPFGLILLGIGGSTTDAEYVKKYEAYLKHPNKEEYYCDLFAGMYNLPFSFTIGYKNRDFVVNQIPPEQLQRLKDIEGKLYTLVQSQYPTLEERNQAAYTIAKNLLESKAKISKETKEYCSWVVANYSNIEKTDIKTNYRSQSFDPHEAEDLDKHVQNLINNNGITLTK